MPLKNEIANLLKSIADLMEFDGENKFKVSAFRNASNVIRRIDGDLEDLIAGNSLQNVKGIGKGILKVIEDYTQNGFSSDYTKLIESVPDGILELFEIRGIGVRKVRQLHDELNITSLTELERNCIEGRVAGLKGFGEKLQDKILEEIQRIKRSRGYILLHKALELGDKYREMLRNIPFVKRVEFTGQLRRKLEIINKIELILSVSNYKENYKTVAKLYDNNEIEELVNCVKLHFTGNEGSEVIIILTDPGNFIPVWFHSTGSEEYLKHLPGNVKDMEVNSEQEIAEKLGFEFTIPEMREGAYFEAPDNLRHNSNLSVENFKGLLHFHTTQSDGLNTLSEMIEGAGDHGFDYMAVCDHSKSAFYANGLSEDRVSLQKKEIDEVRRKTGIKIFHGIESDILKDGKLDYSPDILSSFEFIVASIHSIFNLTENEMTSRIIKAVENEFTDLLAHPTGRLLLSRDPYKINIEKIIDACAANDVAIEINANPHRLDLDWRNIFYAREKGCKFAINPDAHSIEGISDTEYGIMIARKGGIQPEEVINCLNQEDFENYLNRKIKRIV